MSEDILTIRYVQGDIEVERGCVGKGRASIILLKIYDDLDMTPTKIPPSG